MVFVVEEVFTVQHNFTNTSENNIMIILWQGNTWHIIDPLWGESIGHYGIRITNAAIWLLAWASLIEIVILVHSTNTEIKRTRQEMCHKNLLPHINIMKNSSNFSWDIGV